jgi:hypothetical protein
MVHCKRLSLHGYGLSRQVNNPEVVQVNARQNMTANTYIQKFPE